MLSREWRCSWRSADRRCSNYIWVINNFIAYKGAAYIRGFTVLKTTVIVPVQVWRLCRRRVWHQQWPCLHSLEIQWWGNAQQMDGTWNINMDLCFISLHNETTDFDGLVQERCNSSALAMELRLSCTNPSTYFMMRTHPEVRGCYSYIVNIMLIDDRPGHN